MRFIGGTWDVQGWAAAIDALPAEGPLPLRIVLVPSERVAHQLRKELVASGRQALLVGTRFVDSATLATEVLWAAGADFTVGEEARRPARIVALFRRGIGLEYFGMPLLRDRPGWEEAFAHTIGELEEAGWRPETIPRDQPPQVRDAIAIWRALDRAAGRSWTRARLLLEAAARLAAGAGAEIIEGPVLAMVSGHSSGAEARFIGALPGAHVGVLGMRPVRRRYLERLGQLFGDDAVKAATAAVPGPPAADPTAPTERDLLATYLLEPPEILSQRARPTSAGPDGTVDLEEHAGVEAELEATADWVAQQILEQRLPLEEIAVLTAGGHPLPLMVAERLARLPFPDGALPVHVAGGIPGLATPVGPRIRAVLGALAAHLSIDEVAAVLPALRVAGGDGQRLHLSTGRAAALVYSMGTVGGSAAVPDGARQWRTRLVARGQQLRHLAEQSASLADDDPRRAREGKAYQHLLADLDAIAPALNALVDLAGLLLDDRPLAQLIPAVTAFLDEHLLCPPEGQPVRAAFATDLAALTADPDCATLTGADALAAMAAVLGSVRLQPVRFGEPAIYVGPVASAIGLRFRAARIIGLHEGTIPAGPGEDPVISGGLRGPLAPLPDPAERALAGVHALDWAIRSAGERIALSAPRVGLDGSQREPSSLFVEAAAALRRPAAGGALGLAALRRACFLPAREAGRTRRLRLPLTEAALQDRAALSGTLPSHWNLHGPLSLAAVLHLLDPARPPDALDGLLSAPVLAPGLTAEHPISASGLERLLSCPHRFLYERLLHWQEPPSRPPQDEIAPMPYGSLLHRVAESFARECGESFGRRERDLAHWQALAGALADAAFDAFMEEYPLVGAAVRDHQRARLRRQLRDLLEYDWAGPPRRLVDAERPFGWDAPVTVGHGERILHVRGFIDRLDVEGDVTVVRDLKSGKAHPRRGNEADASPARDLQIGLYGMVTETLAAAWGVPARVQAAYVYPDGRSEPERAFRADYAALATATRAWIATAADLLAGGLYLRTPTDDDCDYCPFAPACGPRHTERAARVLAGCDAAAGLRALKEGDE